jgi:hypothetical protein
LNPVLGIVQVLARLKRVLWLPVVFLVIGGCGSKHSSSSMQSPLIFSEEDGTTSGLIQAL